MPGPLAFLGAAAIGGGLGFLGGERSNAMSAREARRNREFSAAEALAARNFNAAEAQKARDFSAEQSATEVQRRVADLRAAGLNPNLALGQTASSGGGVAASGPTAGAGSIPSFQNTIGGGVSTATAIAQAAQTIKIQRDLADAQIEKSRAEAGDITATQLARIHELEGRGDLSKEEARQLKDLFGIKEELLRNQNRQARNSAWLMDTQARDTLKRTAREEEAFRSGFGRFAPFLNSAEAVVQDVFGVNLGRKFRELMSRSIQNK